MFSSQSKNLRRDDDDDDDDIIRNGESSRRKTRLRISLNDRPGKGIGCLSMGTMEGLIWNANKVLDCALQPGLNGINSGLFQTCAGICIVRSLQVGSLLTGSVGTGIFMRHNFDGSWSNPVAVRVATIGVGVTVGATMKDALIFMTDFETVEAFFKTGLRVGGRVNLTLGPIGRSAEGHVGASRAGTSATMTISYSTGADIGASFDGGIVGPRHSINAAFYGEENCDPADIVNGITPFPSDKVTLFSELKDKLIRKCRSSNQMRRESTVNRRSSRRMAFPSLPHHQQPASLTPTKSTLTYDESCSTFLTSHVSSLDTSVFEATNHPIGYTKCRATDVNVQGFSDPACADSHNHKRNNRKNNRYRKRQQHISAAPSDHDPWRDQYQYGHIPCLPPIEDQMTNIDENYIGTYQDEAEWGMRVWSILN